MNPPAARRYVVSASELERYGYCPLSWRRAFEGVEGRDGAMEAGMAEHERTAERARAIISYEARHLNRQQVIAVYAFIALLLGTNGVAVVYATVAPPERLGALTTVLTVLSVLWAAVAVGLYAYTKVRTHGGEPKGTAEGWSRPVRKWAQAPAGARGSLKPLGRAALGLMATIAYIGASLTADVDRQLMSRISTVVALVWLLASAAFLYALLRAEAKVDERQQEEPRPPDLAGGASAAPRAGGKVERGPRADGKDVGRGGVRGLEAVLFVCSLIAALLSLDAIVLHYGFGKELGYILLILAGLWMLVGFYLSYWGVRGLVRLGALRDRFQSMRAFRSHAVIDEATVQWRHAARVMAGVALGLGVNSVILSRSPEGVMGPILEILALVWLMGASLFLFLTMRTEQLLLRLYEEERLPVGKVAYVDTLKSPPLMLDPERGLRGRPDLVMFESGRPTPVEIKGGRIPRGPHFSHILQIGAYFILCEATYGVAPERGLIRYGQGSDTREFVIENSPALRSLVLEMADRIRAAAISPATVHRNHNRPGKCAHCSRRVGCPERLA